MPSPTRPRLPLILYRSPMSGHAHRAAELPMPVSRVGLAA